jgi:hypothetical protein
LGSIVFIEEKEALLRMVPDYLLHQGRREAVEIE